MNIADQQVVDALMRELDKIEKTSPMRDSYARTEPAIVEHAQAGHTFRFITFHRESQEWWKAGVQEWSLHRMRATNFVRSDDVVFDLGCNAGFLTTWFALEVPNGKVVAFDPYPWNAAATRAQAVLNGLHNVEVHAVGIGPRRADLTVSSTSSKTFNAEKSAFFGGNKLRLRIEPLTTFADKLPTFVKIDIEGAEHELGPSIVASGIQRGYVEMHPQFIEAGGGNPAAFLNQLRSGGFRVSPYGPDEQALTAEPAEVRAIAYYFQRSR